MKVSSYVDAFTPYALELDGGRVIRLDRLSQHRAYAGLLLGAPRDRYSQMIVDGEMTRACREFGEDPRPHLIAPEYIDYRVELGRQRVNRDLSVTPLDGAVETQHGRRLPLVATVARFTCAQTVGPPDEAGLFSESIATLVWFQETFGVPVDEAVLGRLREIEWKEIARDVSW